MVQMAFNAQGVDPAFGGFSTDPIWGDGWSKVIIRNDRVVEMGDNKGKMLAMEIYAQDGPDMGKTGTLMCSVWHNDPAKRDQAMQQMAAICFAVGVGGYNDTQELWNRPFYVENKTGRTRKANDGKEYPTNNFTAVRNLQGVEPGKPAAAGAPMAGAPQMPQPPMAPAGYAPPAGGPPAGPGGWAPPAAPGGPPAAPAGGPGWGPPQGGAPAAPSYAPPPAPAGAWAPPAGQPPQQQQQPPAAQWAPAGAPPPAQGGWTPPGR